MAAGALGLAIFNMAGGSWDSVWSFGHRSSPRRPRGVAGAGEVGLVEGRGARVRVRGCSGGLGQRVRGSGGRGVTGQRSGKASARSEVVARGRDAASHLATSTNDPGGKKAGRVLTKWKSTLYHVFSGIKRKFLRMSSGREVLSYF